MPLSRHFIISFWPKRGLYGCLITKRPGPFNPALQDEENGYPYALLKAEIDQITLTFCFHDEIVKNDSAQRPGAWEKRGPKHSPKMHAWP